MIVGLVVIMSAVVGMMFGSSFKHIAIRKLEMKLIQILGTGCPKCEKLKTNAEEAVRLAGTEAQVEKITDIGQITSFGVMMIPALVIDGEVKAVGRLLSPKEIQKLLA